MIQRISKRFLSLLLVAVMVLALVPAITLPAFAATSGTVTGLSDANIGLSFLVMQTMRGVQQAQQSLVQLSLSEEPVATRTIIPH